MAPGSFRGGFGAALNVLKAAGERLASFAGWQTAALNVLKRTLPGPQGLVGAGKGLASFAGWQAAARAPGTRWSCRKGLPRPEWRLGVPRPEWRLGAAGEGLASFAGWQTAALNVLKRTLPGPQGLVGAAGKVCRGLSGAWECRGLSGAWELQGSVWRVLRAGKRQP